ncbi:Rcs stress response system protein RcsF [Gallaecimonas pentaromativorans]|uniref:Rcs stress response system protein RcsF n=1 Tax=Gallaecimonas pentaromativorans TaxID=584787 RepID=UPI00067EFDA2|nr:Rcs stress response system protein RcsF [Gallaecimonas pentaromativorans]MED5524442.1 Rcs stress response system protein RcsF [Pseudomonadota bacterium]
MNKGLLLMALLLTGCAGDYQVNTNLDKERISDYFTPGKVEVVGSDALAGQRYKILGLVSGESCQEEANLPPAQASDARTDARTQAAKMGANAIVIRQCLSLSGKEAAPGCLTQVICQAQAIEMEAP